MAKDPKEIGVAEASMGLAKAILHDRTQRRKFLFQLTLFLLALVIVGYWPLSGWLASSLWLFLLWWAGVAFLTLWILLFAFYDMLRVVQEERDEILKK